MSKFRMSSKYAEKYTAKDMYKTSQNKKDNILLYKSYMKQIKIIS